MPGAAPIAAQTAGPAPMGAALPKRLAQPPPLLPPPLPPPPVGANEEVPETSAAGADLGAPRSAAHRPTSGQLTVGVSPASALALLQSLGDLAVSSGNEAESEPLYRSALRHSEKIFGAEHPDTVGAVLDLARLLQSLGRYPEAERLFKRVVASSAAELT